MITYFPQEKIPNFQVEISKNGMSKKTSSKKVEIQEVAQTSSPWAATDIQWTVNQIWIQNEW